MTDAWPADREGWPGTPGLPENEGEAAWHWVLGVKPHRSQHWQLVFWTGMDWPILPFDYLAEHFTYGGPFDGRTVRLEPPAYPGGPQLPYRQLFRRLTE